MIIYKIQNKINGKIYIGQTKNSVTHRVRTHCHRNSYIGHALRKYGIESFEISVIDSAKDRKILSEKEMYWIQFYDSKDPNGYNLTSGGDGLFEPSEETRLKMRNSQLGKIQTQETIEKHKQHRHT